MHLGKREVPEHESKLTGQRLLQALHDGIGGSAVRALVVAVFNQGQWRVGGPFGVVMCRNGLNERGGSVHMVTPCQVIGPICDAYGYWPLAIFSRAFKMPSAPGFTPTGET